jgi:type III pantothenate kinase
MQRLVVDIGNSTVRVGLVEALTVLRTVSAPQGDVLDDSRFQRMVEQLLGSDTVDELILSSVVPSLNEHVEQLSARLRTEHITVIVEELPYMPLSYRSNETLGIDRYCNALAARALYGSPAIVIDLGTATTVNVINAEGVFEGGAIGLGLGSSYRALHDYTAQLPHLAPQYQESPIGRTTDESIHAGVTMLQLYGLRAMIGDLKDEIGAESHVIVTGGNLKVIPENWIKGASFESNLQLIGAVVFAEQKKRK